MYKLGVSGVYAQTDMAFLQAIGATLVFYTHKFLV